MGDAGPQSTRYGHGVEVEVAGETLCLLPQRAAYWPRRATLLVADAHFGKAAAFRALGQPVPHGTTADNLDRLDQMLLSHTVQRLVFLGDFLHARHGRSDALLASLLAWRQRHALLECVLVRGNHDRHAGDPPDALGFHVVVEPWLLPPFALCHEPGLLEPGHYALAGHLHPAVQLVGPAFERIRLPCFSFDAHSGLLPAFGAFTGAALIAPQPGRRLFVVGDDAVWPVC
ncbi:ligase-associated DNA damage response endonuclease PdeM [Chitinolyticbacter meiyuanensis]|uniref:ligase-associated DNA damage response endonuclease PdeM n=1 Tax=Chitinolyticbacter meiyuanensis TaxID=682798 RepID=UPI0011E5FA0E|nr:ligase-associated DNA damage response endonuclease PdeM [Chitinolyticbacter meiyuanensis]